MTGVDDFEAQPEFAHNQLSVPITSDMVSRAAVVLAEITGEPHPGRFERTMARAVLAAALTEPALAESNEAGS